MRKILLLFAFTACISNLFSQEKIRYGAKEFYYLEINERHAKIDDEVLGNYDIFNDNDEHQVPLNRYVIGENYVLYIGLAISDFPEEINELYCNSDLKILRKEEVLVKRKIYYKLLLEIDELYCYRIIFKTRKSYHTVVLNFVSQDNEIVEQMFTDETFFKRKLNKKEKK